MPPAEPSRQDQFLRYAPLLMGAAALAISLEAFRRSGNPPAEAPVSPAAESSASAPPRATNDVEREPPSPRGASLPIQGLRPTPASGSIASPPRNGALPGSSTLAPRLRFTRSDPGVPPQLAALAAQLHVRSDALVPLADPSGALPPALESRLLAAQSLGSSLATQAHLEGSQRDAIGSILVDYLLRSAAPGSSENDSLKQEALEAIAGLGGPDVRNAAAAALERL